MAMPVVPEARRYTVAEVLDFPPDGNRYEVVRGELLVTPASRYRHQLIVMRLARFLDGYLKPMGFGDAVFAVAADTTWGIHPREAEDLVQPDVFVLPPGASYREWLDVSRLELVAEVLSPSCPRGDRVTKRLTYQRHGVATYWIVDPEAALVEVWHPEDARPEIVTDLLTWKLGEAASELRIPLAELFA